MENQHQNMTSMEAENRRYRKCHRLTHAREFQAVFAGRQSVGGSVLIVYGLPNGLSWNRLGLSVGRKFGGAVRRHRFKRWCREAFRLTRAQQPIGWDWVVVPRRPKKASAPPVEMSATQVRDDFVALVRRLHRRARAEQRHVPF